MCPSRGPLGMCDCRHWPGLGGTQLGFVNADGTVPPARLVGPECPLCNWSSTWLLPSESKRLAGSRFSDLGMPSDLGQEEVSLARLCIIEAAKDILFPSFLSSDGSQYQGTEFRA